MIFLFTIPIAFACTDFFEKSPLAIESKLYPEDISSACIASFVQSGDWDKVNYLLDSPTNDIDLTQVLDLLKNEKRQLARFLPLFDLAPDTQVVTPSFRWAQSLSHIYIDVKFSHRIDAAGCTTIHNLHHKITSDSVYVYGKCILSGHKLVFILDLQLFKEIDETDAEINDQNSGRIEFKLKKAKNLQVWKTIYNGEKPNGMSVWFDMQEMFNKQIESFSKVEL